MFGTPDILRRNNFRVTNHVSSNLLLSTIIIGTSVFSYGFDTGVLDTVQAMTPFERRFGELNPKTNKYFINSTHLAFLNSFPLILYAVGVIVASQIGERFGRRAVLILTNLVCITGTAVCYTAEDYGQMLAGRMIVNMHVGIEAWLVPMYQAEIVPGAIRGAMVSLYAFNHIFAAFISSIITNATSKYTDDSCWKIPVACMFIFPILVLLGTPFVPESPRWLMRKGRFEDAVVCLDYLNNHNEDYVAVDEATLLKEALSEGVTKGKWSDLLKGVNKRRTLIGTSAAAFKQLTGQSFASQYGAIFIKSINVMDPFQATMIKRAILMLGPLSVMLLVDKLGRRTMFLTFASFAAAALMVMGALGSTSSVDTDITIKKGIVAMAMFFPFAYLVSFGATLVVIESEMPHITLRDKSTMIFWSTSNICNFVATFTLPYLLNAPYANLHSKVGFIYGSTSAIGVLWGFFFMPETTGKSLEEIDEMFEARVPAWRTKGWKSNGFGARLTAMENDPHSAHLDQKVADQTSLEVTRK